MLVPQAAHWGSSPVLIREKKNTHNTLKKAEEDIPKVLMGGWGWLCCLWKAIGHEVTGTDVAQCQTPPSPDKMGHISGSLQFSIAPRFHVLQNLLEVLLKSGEGVLDSLLPRPTPELQIQQV